MNFSCGLSPYELIMILIIFGHLQVLVKAERLMKFVFQNEMLA